MAERAKATGTWKSLLVKDTVIAAGLMIALVTATAVDVLTLMTSTIPIVPTRNVTIVLDLMMLMMQVGSIEAMIFRI